MALGQIDINGQLFYTERGAYESAANSGRVLHEPKSHVIGVILENITQESGLKASAEIGQVGVQLPSSSSVVQMYVTIPSISGLQYPKTVQVSLQEL